MNRYAIGGDFELLGLPLEPIDQATILTKGIAGTWSISGRAALASVLHRLQKVDVRHVHLPAYLCECILQPVQALGLEYSFYPIDANFVAQPEPSASSAVLLIHYFGWINPATADLRADASPLIHLIEDASQAVLSDWSAPEHLSQNVFFSMRKFGPTPMGGWCNVQDESIVSSNGFETLAWKSITARLVRGAYLSEPEALVDPGVEAFYLTALREVETFLDEHPACGSMPEIAMKIIAGLDWQTIAERRRANWQTLNELLDEGVETVTHVLPPQVVPLGYVVRLKARDRVRQSLAAQRIFCPMHWPLPQEVSPQRFPQAASLAETCLTLPIDQRYGPGDMERIADAVRYAA